MGTDTFSHPRTSTHRRERQTGGRRSDNPADCSPPCLRLRHRPCLRRRCVAAPPLALSLARSRRRHSAPAATAAAVTAATRLPARPPASVHLPFTCSCLSCALQATLRAALPAARVVKAGHAPYLYAPTYGFITFCGPPVSGSRLVAGCAPFQGVDAIPCTRAPAWVFSSTWDCVSVPDLCVEL